MTPATPLPTLSLTKPNAFGCKRPKAQRAYKRRHGTSLEFFYQFVKVRNENGETVVDTTGILSLACYQDWLSKRKKMPEDPRKTFRKTIQAHCRGSDKRRPFPEAIEESLLKNLRMHDPWKFLDKSRDARCKRKLSTRERRKESGFRKLGYHEALRIKQREAKRFSDQMVITSDEDAVLECLDLLEQEQEQEQEEEEEGGKNDAKRICYRPNTSLFVNFDRLETFEIIDPGFQNLYTATATAGFSCSPHLNPSVNLSHEALASALNGVRTDNLSVSMQGDLNTNSVSQLQKLWTQESRSVLESFHDVSCEEIEKVLELREKLEPDFDRHFGRFVPDDVGGDVKLLRFLRKSKQNVDEALRGFQSMLAWRERNGVNAVRERLIAEDASIDSLLKSMKSTRSRGLYPFFSFDKRGDVLDIWVFGDDYEDPTHLSVDEFVEEHVCLAEFRSIVLDRLSRAQSRLVKFLWFLDVRKTSFRQRVWCPYFIHVAVIDQRYYPSQNSNILVVGGSRFMQIVWKVMCHVADEDTKRDIYVFDSNTLKDNSLVDQAPDQLTEACIPQFLGGSVADKGGVGTTKLPLSSFV